MSLMPMNIKSVSEPGKGILGVKILKISFWTITLSCHSSTWVGEVFHYDDKYLVTLRQIFRALFQRAIFNFDLAFHEVREKKGTAGKGNMDRIT